MALGYPEIGFTLTSGPRALLECPPAEGLGERFFQLFGERPDLSDKIFLDILTLHCLLNLKTSCAYLK